MSISPQRLGALESGDRLEGLAELEVSTTCLQPMPKCVGRTYHFSPEVRARIVLARSPRAIRGSGAVPVSGWRNLRCSQQLPNRNHHCVLVIPGATAAIREASRLPCAAGRCHLNLVVGANHPGAKGGHKLVIGVDGDRGISQNKGLLSAAVYRPGRTRAEAVTVGNRTPRVRRLAVGSRKSKGTKKRVIFSQRLNRLRSGERLVVDAKAIGSIKTLDFATLVQSQLILARYPGATTRDGKQKRIAAFKAQFGVANGFNCTKGRSAHSNPCTVRKVGVMRILRNARLRPKRDQGRYIPLYANLVVGARAVGARGHRRKGGDRMRIKRGYINVRRYRPASEPDPAEGSP